MTRLLVVGAGPPTREGGVDVFLELVAVLRGRPDTHFAWVGARSRSSARRLDAETERLGVDGRVDWLPRGSAPAGNGVVRVVTARSAAAAMRALEDAVAGTTIGLASDPAVADVLERVGSVTVPYPDVARLGQLIVSMCETNDTDPPDRTTTRTDPG